jgi:hypothetical protein
MEVGSQQNQAAALLTTCCREKRCNCTSTVSHNDDAVQSVALNQLLHDLYSDRSLAPCTHERQGLREYISSGVTRAGQVNAKCGISRICK